MDNPDQNRVFYHPYDNLGHLRQKNLIVENGTIKTWLYNEREAKKNNINYCSYSASFTDSSAWPLDLEMLDGQKRASDLCQDLKDGFYLHNLHYLSVSDPQKMTLFGLTRGGFLRLKDGKPCSQMANMRFEVSIPELLNNIQELGLADEHKVWTLGVKSPAIITTAFNLTDTATNH